MAFIEDGGFPHMQNLLECTSNELAKRYIPACGFEMIQPGNTPVIDHAGLDGCSDCDELIVWMEGEYPVGPGGFPDIDDDGTCSSGLAYILHVGIFRCAPLWSNDEPPTPEEQTAAALSQSKDREAMRAAIKCCSKGYEYLLGAYVPYGPEGGVMGGDWTVTIGPSLD